MSDLDPGLVRFAEYLDRRFEQLEERVESAEERAPSIGSELEDKLGAAEGIDELADMLKSAQEADAAQEAWLYVYSIKETFYHMKPEYKPENRSRE